MPYDLLQAGRRLSFNLGEIFPHLSYPVVTALDRGDLDALYEAQIKYAPGQLGDNATKEFILRHVFEVAPELIKQSSDLLRVLLRRHYWRQRIPNLLEERLIQLLRQNSSFSGWPLETLVPDREAFFTFLQERWPIFLERMISKRESGVRENDQPYGLAIEGLVNLPFDHHDIRVYMDNLFLEGLLHSVPHEQAAELSKSWASIGVRSDPAGDRSLRLTKLIESIQKSIPVEDARHEEWFHFAHGWAELTVLAHEQGQTPPQIKSLQVQVDTAFTAWLLKRHAGLANLPPDPPVMLHHLPRFLAHYVEENRNSKVALVLVDGLSLDQWIVFREALVSQHPKFRFREASTFAWVPSITSVSHQAAFAGKPPLYFPTSIQTTDKEPVLWLQFWADHGFSQNEVVYAKGLGDGSLGNVEEFLSHPKSRVAGLVIDKVDKIMHGMELGTAGMHNQVRQWAQQPYMAAFLDLLLDRGFRVFLTSDHGNVEARGCGGPAEGAVADLRGERARVYSDELLRSKIKDQFPEAIAWPPAGLPDSYLPLLAPGRAAFVREGEHVVAHGGISIEELIVPFIQIQREGV